MFVLPAFLTPIANLVQNNALTRYIGEPLLAQSRYRADARREPLERGTGATAAFMRLGAFDVDLKPAPPVGAVPRAAYQVEQYVANPEPFANAVDVDAPTSFIQKGNRMLQVLDRQAEWAGRTSSRKARGRLFATYFGGQSIVRTAGINTDTSLVVNSLAGFRFAPSLGQMVPVSAANALPITIVAGSTITNRKVIGVVPANAYYPDGPGTLLLDGQLGAAVVVQSYVYVQGASTTTPLPYIVRPNAKVSTEALATTDKPTLVDILSMKSKLVGLGVPPHPLTGTYHLHVDETFMPLVVQDQAWREAFKSEGLSPIFQAGSYFSPGMGITVIENNDSPALGRGREVAVGATPASSISMEDIGLDVRSSTGVAIRRAIMTGSEVLTESYVDQEEMVRSTGAELIHTIGDLRFYRLGNGMTVMIGNVEGWMLLIRPPLDERALVATVTVANTFDFVPATDQYAASNSSDRRPYKRAVGLEYGSVV